MADETPQAPAEAQPQPNPAQERITQLSDKVKQEAEGRVKAETEAADAKKQAAFAEGFIDVMSTYPAAKEFKAEIHAKVASGYSVEDATLVVLGKAGKLGIPASPAETQNPAGGSSSTTLPQGGAAKNMQEMTTAEKREALSGLSAQELFSPFRTN